MNEVWKDVVGYEGLYQVSNCGGIRIVRVGSPYYMKLMSCLKSNKGYYTVMMSDRNGKKKRRSVHRMVAEAFIENPNNYPQVNHKDEDKTNNRVDNLEWCSAQYNTKYYYDRHPEKSIGATRVNAKGCPHPHTGKRMSLRVLQMTLDGEIICEWDNSRSVFRETGMSDWSVSQCCRGVWKTAYGFKWRYAD